MPKLSKIQAADITEDIDIDFGGGEVLHLTIYPNKFTQRRINELQALGDAAEDDDDVDYHGEFARLFFEGIKEWDLEDDAGAVYPFTAATIEELAIPTMSRLTSAINEALRPDPKPSRRSRGR